MVARAEWSTPGAGPVLEIHTVDCVATNGRFERGSTGSIVCCTHSPPVRSRDDSRSGTDQRSGIDKCLGIRSCLGIARRSCQTQPETAWAGGEATRVRIPQGVASQPVSRDQHSVGTTRCLCRQDIAAKVTIWKPRRFALDKQFNGSSSTTCCFDRRRLAQAFMNPDPLLEASDRFRSPHSQGPVRAYSARTVEWLRRTECLHHRKCRRGLLGGRGSGRSVASHTVDCYVEQS